MIEMWLEPYVYELEKDLYCPTCDVVIDKNKCPECFIYYSYQDFEEDKYEREVL